uniref:Uncharacterized protein n=1 Tax=Panagrolaimus sp. ES5 TaxID=591445 RepID=A0AC34FGY9_9BILA
MDSLTSRRNMADILIAHDIITKNADENLISLNYNNHGKTQAGGNYLYSVRIKKSLLTRHFSSRISLKVKHIKLADYSKNSLRQLLTENKTKL